MLINGANNCSEKPVRMQARSFAEVQLQETNNQSMFDDYKQLRIYIPLPRPFVSLKACQILTA
jgi:hypothetical protein